MISAQGALESDPGRKTRFFVVFRNCTFGYSKTYTFAQGGAREDPREENNRPGRLRRDHGSKEGPSEGTPRGARGHFITQRCAFHNREPYESRIRVTARGGFAPPDPPAIYIEVNNATEAAKERSTPRTLLSITFAQHPHPHARRCAQHCEFAARSTLAPAPRRVKPRALNLHCTFFSYH